MRPYILWLARGYCVGRLSIRAMEHGGTGALEDWIKYQSEQRFLVDAWRR